MTLYEWKMHNVNKVVIITCRFEIEKPLFIDVDNL